MTTVLGLQRVRAELRSPRTQGHQAAGHVLGVWGDAATGPDPGASVSPRASWLEGRVASPPVSGQL